ncbi:two-component response regulator ARR2 [Manihot esculenta]|uniref:Two-component response regulator n=1 Tax=Manihot esculenta TaxID=3983 RepID=A0A2C9WAU2_MANES|nr:two-component response regulator ARR2 [Manihot esculenta]OAY56080.1 hypothetical protein MANES_03G201000v8 [Manihot esculenta]
MDPNSGKGSLPTSSSSGAWKAEDLVDDKFPVGLRVLAVDDNQTCLLTLEKMLMSCLYEVTKCSDAETALSLLRQNRNGYDIVLSDVHMPDMDGFELLEQIVLEMDDLPVVMMSYDEEKNMVMKGITQGACDYLIKPVGIETLKNIWQHVVRKKRNAWKHLEQSGSVEDGDRQHKQSQDTDYSYSANGGNWRNSKKKKGEEEEAEERDNTSTLKKPRVVWSVELHQQFVAAVNQLGIDKAVPKKILELMNVPGLTRENVASHLQKYRLYLRRLSGASQHQSNLNNGFICPQEATYGPMSSFNGIDLQTLAATGQLPAQSLATLQAAGLGQSRIPMPMVDQRNHFSFENPELRLGEGQQQQLSSSKLNLHGIPTTMEPKQLANLHHSAQPLGSMNVEVNAHGGQNNSLLMQMSQSQSRGQTLNETTGSHLPILPSSMAQPVLSNPVVSEVIARNGLAENGRGSVYNLVSQSSSMLNFPLNSAAELSGNSLPLVSSLTSNPEMKGSVGFMPSYDIFSDLNQHKSHDWELGMNFNASQQNNSLQSNLNVGPSVLPHQGFSSSQRIGLNISAVGKPMFTAEDASAHVNAQHFGQVNTFFSDNSASVKPEIVSDASCQTTLFPEQFGQEDLMSTLLKQQQGGVPAENEFDIDGSPLDDIPQ